MATKSVKVQVCDNPACGKETIVPAYEPALGVYLTGGTWHNGAGGGSIPKTYACSFGCVQQAIEFMIKDIKPKREPKTKVPAPKVEYLEPNSVLTESRPRHYSDMLDESGV